MGVTARVPAALRLHSSGVMTRATLAVLVMLTVCDASPVSAVCVTDGQGPCYRFWKTEAVFVAKVVQKEPLTPAPASSEFVALGGNYRLNVVVVEGFRGVKTGTQLILFAPDGVCGGVGANDGEELFVYASHNKSGELWAHGCGESKPVENAQADLAYARSVTNHGPSALIYGDVFERLDKYGDYRDFTAMQGIRIRVSNARFQGEATTDREGNYSIDVPDGGAYLVEVGVPRGYAVWWDEAKVSVDVPDRRGCFAQRFQLKPR
jgi:hypothetical protein